jgi:hypothetical protein
MTGLVRGLLCRGCNLGLGNLEDNPAFAYSAGAYLDRWYQHLFELFGMKEEHMTSNAADDDGKAAPLMRQAILHELQQPFAVEPPPPANWLQAVSRFLVTQATQDLNATKEVLDRIDGKAQSAAGTGETAKPINVTWKYPSSKLSLPQGDPIKQRLAEPQRRSKRSSVRRRSNSSMSASGRTPAS